jgi:hypothetical protein
MILAADVDYVLSAARTARNEVLAARNRSRAARLEMQWQGARARKQVAKLGQSLDELKITLERMDSASLVAWSPVCGALDDVLLPLD